MNTYAQTLYYLAHGILIFAFIYMFRQGLRGARFYAINQTSAFAAGMTAIAYAFGYYHLEVSPSVRSSNFKEILTNMLGSVTIIGIGVFLVVFALLLLSYGLGRLFGQAPSSSN